MCGERKYGLGARTLKDLTARMSQFWKWTNQLGISVLVILETISSRSMGCLPRRMLVRVRQGTESRRRASLEMMLVRLSSATDQS